MLASDNVLDCVNIASSIKSSLALDVKRLSSFNKTATLAVVIVGSDPASHIYVRNKHKFCQDVGIISQEVSLPDSITTEELLEQINLLNNDKGVNGILVQLPLPKHIDKSKVLEAILPDKDVDGFCSVNSGMLFNGLWSLDKSLIPCTAKACFYIVKDVIGMSISGKNVVVVGSSNIVGKPTAIMFSSQGATVTICNSKTKDLSFYTKNADIIVCAAGVPGLIKGSMIKDGSVVIDVGINKVVSDDGKSTVVGDCDFKSCVQKASAITPVPNGVGRLTVAFLAQNTLIATCKQNNLTL